MKKALVSIMALAMCLALAACGSGNDPAGTTPPATSEPAASTPASSPVESTPAETTPTETVSPPASGTTGSKLDAIKAAGKITMITSPDFAPYEFIDETKQGDEKYVGVDIELGRYIAAELGVELEIKPMEFDATLATLAAGGCDIAISGYTPSEDRKSTMDFTDVYYEGDQVVVVRKDDAEKYKEVGDLKGLPVGAQNGSEQQRIVEEQLEGAELKLFTKVPEAIMAIKSKQVEAVVLEGPNADQILALNDDLVVSEVAVEGEVQGTAIAVPKGDNADLIAELNRIIEKAKSEQKMDEWITLANEINSGMAE